MTGSGRSHTACVLAVMTAIGCRYAPSPGEVLAEAERLRTRYESAATNEAIGKYREALAALRGSDERAAARAGQGVGAAFEQLGSLQKSLQAYREALAIAESSGDRLLESELRSDVGAAQALSADQSELLDEAERHCLTALDLARSMSGLRQEAKALQCVGDVLYGRGNLGPALESYSQAERLWTRAGDIRGIAQAALAQGWVHSDLRQFDLAVKFYADARSRWMSLGDRRQLAITLVADARLLQRRGNYQDALDAFDSALAALEPMGDAAWQGSCLTGKARIHLSAADVNRAVDFYGRALELFEAAGLKGFAVDALMSVGSALLGSGDDLGALARFERALVLAAELGNLRWQAWAHRHIGSVYLVHREPVLAQQHLEKSLELARPLDERRLSALVLADLGETHDLLNHHDRALAYFAESLAVSRAAEDREEAARGLFARGALEERQGSFVSARRSLEQALSDRERLFGTEHPLVAETRAVLARIDFAVGATRRALTGALGAEATSRDHLRQTLRYLPEWQGLAFAERRPRGLDLAISILTARPAESATPVFDGVIQARGLVLDELAGRNHTTDPQRILVRQPSSPMRTRLVNVSPTCWCGLSRTPWANPCSTRRGGVRMKPSVLSLNRALMPEPKWPARRPGSTPSSTRCQTVLPSCRSCSMPRARHRPSGVQARAPPLCPRSPPSSPGQDGQRRYSCPWET